MQQQSNAYNYADLGQGLQIIIIKCHNGENVISVTLTMPDKTDCLSVSTVETVDILGL